MENETKGILKVGVIGSGNFGGQVANEASLAGFPAIALNASRKDLELLNPNVIPFVIGDGKGTGKNGEYAKQFLLDHISIVEEKEIANFITSNDVVVIAGSAGGGFGSNTVPILTDVLSQVYPDTLFIVLTTFPAQSETYTAQNYTERFMRALIPVNEETGEATPYVPYIIYDNENYKDLTPVEMNQKILETAVNDLRALRGDYILETTTGGIDERDLLTTLSTPGRLVVSTIKGLSESELIDGSVMNTVKNDIDKSAQVKLVDDKLISASAIMYNFNTDLAKYAPAITSEMQSVFGDHITDYRNEVIGSEEEEFVVTILAGLTEPTTRIDKVIARRQAIENTINTRKAATTKLNSVEAGTLGLKPKNFGGTNAVEKLNTADVLKKYGAMKTK